MKILVAIANYGTKNISYVQRLIKEYRSMPYKVKIVILSNIEKDFGDDVEVELGLPEKDPWSLPFGHKKLFADNIDKYDLFIYSEDDTLLTQKNIEAFLDATRILPENMIAGFLRYEESPQKKKFCTSIHSYYHWEPNSVNEYGGEIFAYFTNEHAALFILTRAQLKKAIDSGGFLVPPHKGKYDMLVTAATDPYTQCGFKKMICVSRINDFFLHHLPNIYNINLGQSKLNIIGYDELMQQISIILNYREIENFSNQLFQPSVKISIDTYNKMFHTTEKPQLLKLIKSSSKTVLSVGCVDGINEQKLIERNHEVTGIPLDNIIASLAIQKGIKLTKPGFDEAFKELAGKKFDCIIFDNVLQYIENPDQIIKRFKQLFNKNTYIIISIPNFKNISIMKKKSIFNPRKELKNFLQSGIHYTDYSIIHKWLKKVDLKIDKVNKIYSPKLGRINKLTFGVFSSLLAVEIIIRTKV